MPTHFQKIKTGGVRISDELLLVRITHPLNQNNKACRICRILAEDKISILFLTIDHEGGNICTTYCVGQEHEGHVRRLIESETVWKAHAQVTPAVGMLSMFPHQSQLQMLGVSLYAFGKANLTILGLSSSLAALSFLLKYTHLERALTALSQFFDLPPDPAHFRSSIRVRQA